MYVYVVVVLLMPVYSRFDQRTQLALRQNYHCQCYLQNCGMGKRTYAAVIANTSARFAPARPMRHTDNSTLNAAMVANLAGIDCTQYSTTMEAIGIREAKRLVIQYVMR